MTGRAVSMIEMPANKILVFDSWRLGKSQGTQKQNETIIAGYLCHSFIQQGFISFYFVLSFIQPFHFMHVINRLFVRILNKNRCSLFFFRIKKEICLWASCIGSSCMRSKNGRGSRVLYSKNFELYMYTRSEAKK